MNWSLLKPPTAVKAARRTRKNVAMAQETSRGRVESQAGGMQSLSAVDAGVHQHRQSEGREGMHRALGRAVGQLKARGDDRRLRMLLAGAQQSLERARAKLDVLVGRRDPRTIGTLRDQVHRPAVAEVPIQGDEVDPLELPAHHLRGTVGRGVVHDPHVGAACLDLGAHRSQAGPQQLADVRGDDRDRHAGCALVAQAGAGLRATTSSLVSSGR
jgi:hypothetical protein